MRWPRFLKKRDEKIEALEASIKDLTKQVNALRANTGIRDVSILINKIDALAEAMGIVLVEDLSTFSIKAIPDPDKEIIVQEALEKALNFSFGSNLQQHITQATKIMMAIEARKQKQSRGNNT